MTKKAASETRYRSDNERKRLHVEASSHVPYRCSKCRVELTVGENWYPSRVQKRDYICNACELKRQENKTSRRAAAKRDAIAMFDPARPDDPQLKAFVEAHKETLAQLNNTHTGIKEGYLYAIRNPAWPGYVKVGRAVDPFDRLGSYQTGDPFRAYEMIHYRYTDDRIRAEAELKSRLSEYGVGGEWFLVPDEQVVKFHMEEVAKNAY